MSNKNIFEENVMIPDIVNAKVDQALSDLPDHGAIREVSPKKKTSTRKTSTRVLAFAAAASVLLLSYSVYRAVRSGKQKDPSGSLISENTDRPDVTENTDGTISQRFTIMVAGQGLREDRSIPLENMTSNFTGISMAYGNFEFECEFPLSVAGDNVESVEYTFENADVAIIHNGTSQDNITGEKINLDDRYLSDWTDWTGEPNMYCLGGKTFDIGTVDFYHSYKETAPFGSEGKCKKYLCVQVENRQDLYEHVQLRERDGYDPFTCDFFTAMCKDIVVTVKVNFKDGSSDVTDIGIKGGEVPYTFQDRDGEDYTVMWDGFVCYIKGSSEEPDEVHLRSYEDEDLPPEAFSDDLDKEPDPEVVQEQERLKKIVEEKNILNDPDLPVIPNTFENGNGGIGWSSGEDWECVSFGLPFIADGEDVDHVEFRSLCEDLCFYVYYRLGDEGYRIEGTESSIGSGRNDAAFAEDPEHPQKGEQVYYCYSSFSMQYPIQEMKNYELYVEIDVRGNEKLNAMDTDVYTQKGYEDSEFFNTAFEDKTIEMTVYYKDGTSVTKKIAFALILEPSEEVPSSNSRNLYAYIVE